MNPVIDDFLDRPASHKFVFWILSLAIISGMFWQLFYKARLGEKEKLDEKIETLENQIVAQSNIKKKLKPLKAELEGIEKKLRVVLLELPDKREIENLLTSISVLARDTGLEVLKFAPGGERKKDFIAEIPVAMEIEGTYHQMTTFFDEVAHLPRIVNITGISADILMENNAEILVRGTCVVTVFRYLEESERIKPDTKKSKKRRRKFS